jgi:hypothetical protein
MDPDEFLVLAGECAVGPRQGDWRTATILAYYAAFHVARRLLREAGFAVPAMERAHRYLSMRLQNSGHPDVVLAGDQLYTLRRWRNNANYDLDHPFEVIRGIQAVNQAMEAIRVFRDLHNEPAILTRVVDAIRVYEHDLGEETWHAP